MGDHLPDIYVRLRDAYPEVADAFDRLGEVTERAGPLDGRTQRLVKLGIAIGAEGQGAVRSNVRKALGTGVSPEEIRHVALLAITTAGWPTSVAASAWIEDVLGEA
jgi:4-carboxymuconolactone decarboxylase